MLSRRETGERRRQKTAEEVIEPSPASVLDDPEPSGVTAGHAIHSSGAKARAASELRAQGRTQTEIAVLVGLNSTQCAHQAIRRCREQQTGPTPSVQPLAYRQEPFMMKAVEVLWGRISECDRAASLDQHRQ
jgi:hypothetical protein